MTDDNPISKWRAAGQQHPGPADQTRSDSPARSPPCQVSADLAISHGSGQAGGQISRALANPQVVMADSRGERLGVVPELRHEVGFAPGTKIDFVSRGIGIEIKTLGGPTDLATAKQLLRYSCTGERLRQSCWSPRAGVTSAVRITPGVMRCR